MIYLASVYSLNHTSDSLEDMAVRETRYRYVCKRAGELMAKGEHIYSPIAHNHVIALMTPNMPKTWDFWKRMDLHVLSRCNAVYVLNMPGVKESTGVQAEIEYALSVGIPVVYLDCPDYEGE